MEKRVKMFEVGYDYIAPGSLVVARTPYDRLTMGRVYKVTECHEPEDLEGVCWCSLCTHPGGEGEHSLFPHTTRLREVSTDELTEDQSRLREHHDRSN